MQEAVWNPPGAGFWRIEAGHCLGAMTPIGQHLMERGELAWTPTTQLTGSEVKDPV